MLITVLKTVQYVIVHVWILLTMSPYIVLTVEIHHFARFKLEIVFSAILVILWLKIFG